MSTKTELVLFVNGIKVNSPHVKPETTLLSFLRRDLKLNGTKLGCGEGGCGACTVMVSDVKNDQVRHRSVNACLIPVVSLHGNAITTIEGIGSTKNKMHSIQKRIADSHGSQCGFCTPGIVMSMYTLYRNSCNPDIHDIETYLQGNLCRCTGYRPILEGFKIFTEDWTKYSFPSSKGCNGPVNGKCCQDQSNEEGLECHSSLFDGISFIPPDPSQEPIFPQELRSNIYSKQSLIFHSESMTWFKPSDLKELLKLKSEYPHAKIVVGSTELGVEMKFRNILYPVMIQASHLKEMNEILDCGNYISIGASCSLTDIVDFCTDSIKSLPEYKTRILKEMKDMLKWFAGQQVRNVACIGGNIITGSPISDLNPILMAAKAQLVIQSMNNKNGRTCEFNPSFYSGYRKTTLNPDEILLSVHLPWNLELNGYFYAYKQSKRKEDDITIVNAAFSFKTNPDHRSFESASMAFGGMGITTVLAPSTSKYLIGKKLSNDVLEEASKLLMKELPLPPDAPGGMIRYRHSLVVGFLSKPLLELTNFLLTAFQSAPSNVTDMTTQASQYFQTSKSKGPIQKAIKHQSSDKQATGEAVYVDDMPHYDNELYVGWVLSSKPRAKIKKIDPSKALAIKNVLDFISFESIREKFDNTFQLVDRRDEIIFAEEDVYCIGQIIGIVLVEGTQEEARRAAALVEVDYIDISHEAIFTIEEAIAKNSYYSITPNGSDYSQMIRGSPFEVMQQSGINILEGTMRTGAQDHFYLETHSALVVPEDADEFNVYSSTQNPGLVQQTISEALGVPEHKIFCHNKRMGGGFGGKQRSMPYTLPLAIAAKIHGRPVRMMLDRDEDMLMTGQRHPFLAKYKIGYDNEGNVHSVILDLYNNAGWTIDLSAAVMSKAMYHCDNAYYFPNISITGRICKTNVASNTAFRGFGAPQGMSMVEAWMEHLAITMKMDPVILRTKNMVQNHHVTYYGQTVTNCTVQRCWEECLEKSQYYTRLTEVTEFNERNTWKKRGISIIPTKYGIAYGVLFLHQATAIVHIYKGDGSVLISHGGTEMGQGLYTKSIQVASQVLDIPIEKIHISKTSTDKVPNGSVTGASVGTDIYGQAVMNACVEINKRLEPYKRMDPQGGWASWISSAYLDRVQLTVSGFFSTPDIGTNPVTNTGNHFNYFTYGAACSLVEIDVLTGTHTVLETTIVMDLGQSLNPGIDIGQIEGAFIQGYGMFTMEEMLYSSKGSLINRGPGSYKIPGFGDIPKAFNVHLLKGASNPRAVYSSKAVGEPPLFLSSSIYFAIKNAVRGARNSEEDFDFFAPATAEKIRLGCQDIFIDNIVPKLPQRGTYVPWNINI
ncbi:xanthine dehydrogenase [Lepeophtheirus salmonis]|uniref:xanthine dehydrogenase n=1 Tax=Lepeophtheirus salmonis TaxID=72036 RepID=UPI003AF37811